MMTHAERLAAIRVEKEAVADAAGRLIQALNMHRAVCDEQNCAIHRRLLFLVDTAAGMKHTYEAAEREWS